MNSRDKITYTLSQKKAFDLNRHISVTAGAGSGKTAVLVNRYLKILLEENVRVSEIVAITFTEKAAAELKNRIVEDVNELIEEGMNGTERDRTRSLQDEARSLLDIKEQLTSANIMTIHAFCAKILREFPVEAGVDANFSVLQGIEQRLTLQDSIVETLKKLATLPDVALFLSEKPRLSHPKDDADKEELAALLRIVGRNALRTILGRLVDKRDIVDKLIAGLYGKSDEELIQYWDNFVETEAKKDFEEKFPLEEWIANLESVLTIAKGKNAKVVANLVSGLKRSEKIDDQIQIVKEILPLILTKSGTIGKRNFLGSRVDSSSVGSEIEFLVSAAKVVGDTAQAGVRAREPGDDDKLLIDVSRKIFNLYRKVLEKYELKKNLAGQLDFEDLQLKVKYLLENEPIRERLAEKYKYIMVDEYQDTNQLQYDILKPLVSDLRTGNLFIVGDKKQSVYGFRNADVRVFDKTTSEIIQQMTDKDFEWEDETLESDEMEQRGEIHLADNFRLLPNLVGFVNLVFSRIMGSGSESEFHVEYEPLIKGRANDEPGCVELVLLPYIAKHRANFQEIERAAGLSVEHAAGLLEEEIIAKRIKKLIADKAPIWKRDSETGQEASQSIKYGDIAILLRSRTNLKQIESAFEKHDIPYIVTGGIGFYQSQEIYDIYNYLQFLLTPQDDVALAGILRSPFFGLSDAQLYEVSLVTVCDSSEDANADSKDLAPETFWDKLQRYATEHPDDRRIQRTIELLNEHLNIADRIPLTSLIRRILNDTAAIGVLAYGARGEQNLANYEKLLDVAREFEGSDFSNLFDFMERLRILINEEPREGHAPTEVSENAVQIMTVHAAKGLEFPVVILPYIDRRFQYDNPPYIDDALGLGFQPSHPERNYQKSEPAITEFMKVRSGSKTEAEEKRIFYVATTRARDMLILSGRVSKKRQSPNWMNWLLNALGLDGIPVGDEGEDIDQVIRSSGKHEFPIRIIRSADEIELVEEEPEPETHIIEIPEIAIEGLSDEPEGTIFSEEHFITYAQCPTKYHLKYQLGMPEPNIFNEQISLLEEDNYDGTIPSLLDVIVHDVLKRIKTPSPKFETIEETINQLIERHSELDAAESRELQYEVEKHVYNFLISELAQKALDAPETHCEYTIAAKLGENFVTGTIDRLFKNDAEAYEVIVYKTRPINNVEHAAGLVAQAGCLLARKQDACATFNAMLVLKLFPTQKSVTTTIFFTNSGSEYSLRYDSGQLPEIEQKFMEKIVQMLSDKFEKNMSHCNDCPYAEDGVCILSEPLSMERAKVFIIGNTNLIEIENMLLYPIRKSD